MAELTAGQRAAARAAKARRGELGLTQKQLADKAGVHHRTIQNLERGLAWPHAQTLAQIERLGLEWYAGRLNDIAAEFDAKADAELNKSDTERNALAQYSDEELERIGARMRQIIADSQQVLEQVDDLQQRREGGRPSSQEDLSRDLPKRVSGE